MPVSGWGALGGGFSGGGYVDRDELGVVPESRDKVRGT